MVRRGFPITLEVVDAMFALTNPEYGMIFIVITIVVAPIAGIAFARSGSALKTLGKGRFAIGTEPAPKPGGPAREESGRSDQTVEVRQMLEARSYRRVRRGQPALDIEAEMQRLLEPEASDDEKPLGAVSAPAPGTPFEADASLREEVRQHVIARNERLVRQGKEALDVEMEVERRLSGF